MSHRKQHSLLTIGLALIGILACAPGCGSDSPRCGDGVLDTDLGEQCDNNTESCCDCTVCLPAQTTIRWAFNDNAVPGFDDDGCIETGVSTMEVEILGPVTQTVEEGCSLRQVVISDLPIGVYTARLRPLNSDGELMITAPVEQGFQTSASSIDLFVNIPPEAWIGPYTGTYFFNTTWNGADCALAVPTVVEQRVTMNRDGTNVPLMTSAGGSLDGPCQASSMSQSATGIPFGFATVHFQGLDGDGVVQYDQEFETFVGIGTINSEYSYDITAPLPDAGVPDAGVVDAGVPDAGTIDASM